MNNFIISAFADEIDPSMSEQIRVLKECGIHHIELRGADGINVSEMTIDQAKKYKTELDRADIKVSSIGSPIGKIGIEDDFAPHLEMFKHVMKLARLFESPYVRMFSFFIDRNKNPDDFEKQVVDRWKEFLKVANEYPEITLLHENEKEIFGDVPKRCVRLLQDLNWPKNVQFAFDPANFVQCDVEVFPKAYHLMEDNIAYVHIKDALYKEQSVTPAGFGDGHVKDVLEALIYNNFHGFASIEPHLSEFVGFSSLEKNGISIKKDNSETDGEAKFQIAVEALRKILNSLGQEWK